MDGNETLELVDIATIMDKVIEMKKVRNNEIKKQPNGGRKGKKGEDMKGSGGVEEKDISNFYQTPGDDSG